MGDSTERPVPPIITSYVVGAWLDMLSFASRLESWNNEWHVQGASRLAQPRMVCQPCQRHLAELRRVRDNVLL